MRSASSIMSPDDYIRQSQERHGGDVVPLRSAERPAPDNVTDGRFFGDELFAEIFSTGSAATADQAAKISAVYFCISLIAEAGGNCPIDVTVDGKPASDFPLADVLSYAPNPMQTAAEFWPSMLFRAALGGHAFAEPVLDGEEIYLWPLHPDQQSIDWRERGFTLHYAYQNGSTRNFNPSQLFWFAGLSDARLQPLTPWKMAKGSLDFALALETQGRTFFKEAKRLPGVIESDQKLDPEVYDRLSVGINRWKTGKIPLLEQGLKFKPAGSNNVEAQFVELIDQRTHEMARYWRIPRSFYAAADGANGKSQEQEAQTFVKYTLRPWLRRIEQAIALRLLTPDQRKRYKIKFNLDALLRGDSATQWKNAVLARTAGVMSIDELRVNWFGLSAFGEDWSEDPRAPLNSNRAADTITGGETSPHDANADQAIEETVDAAIAARTPPEIHVHVTSPRPGKTRTVVTKHDDKGRIAEFEREEIEDPDQKGEA
jgi:HK97 family phage portal protein